MQGAKTPCYKLLPKQKSLIEKWFAMLDSIIRLMPFPSHKESDWGRKRRRVYGRLVSGITYARGHNEQLYFLTLTSTPESPDIRKSWIKLVKRIRRKYKDKGKFEYCKVSTSEGYGVIHCLFKGVRLEIDWLRDNWRKIHGAPQMKLVRCFGKIRKLATYLCGYFSKQPDLSLGYSKFWVFPRWISVFKEIILSEGFRTGVRKWNWMLANYHANSYKQGKLFNIV